MVKRTIFLGMILAILAGCAENLYIDGLPILRVDDQHMALENYPGEPYELQPGPGFALQLSGYTFRIPETLGIDSVNSIQLVTGPEQAYIIPIDPQVTLYKATGDTLSPVEGSAPFAGLAEGDVVTVGIGYTFPDGRFYPAWMGIVTVKGENP